MSHEVPLLLFYPTSAVHVRDWQQVFQKLEDWKIQALVYEPQEYFAPGILAALERQGIPTRVIERGADLDFVLPADVSVLVLGAAFEAFALDLIAWARFRGIPVAAIEEVAQLGLNQNEINNYDAPFDRLFVASPDEFRRFVALGYPQGMLQTSGLLAYDRLAHDCRRDDPELRRALGIADRPKPIVYTTSPLCSRISIHTKDDLAFRNAVLKQIAIANGRTARPVVIKLHPSEDRVEIRSRMENAIPGAIVIGREHPMDELFAITGVLVNRGNSQTCLEAALRGVPTVIVACGLRTLFHEIRGACVVDAFDAIPDAISRALSESPTEVDDLKADHFFSPPEGVASLVASELEKLAGNTPVTDESRSDWLLRTVLFVGENTLALRLAKRLGTGSAWRETVLAALEAHLNGRRDEAIARWQDCIECSPGWFWPHFELAHALVAAGIYPRAIEHANKAIELLPPHYLIWHELPMRRMIMASLRAMGDISAAGAELAGLEGRSLVDVVPELLLEKAEQLIAAGSDLAPAFDCLERALAQIEEIPVNEVLDRELRQRAESLLLGIGEHWERERKYREAASCYASISRRLPADTWPKFALARVRLAQRRPFSALKILLGISGIPGAARAITERALPESCVMVLAPLWPVSRGGGLKSIRLVTHSFAWLADALRKSRPDWPDLAATSLLLTLFAAKHFARRLVG